MVSAKLNTAYGVFCFLSLTCGIAYSVIVSKLMNFIIDTTSSYSGVDTTSSLGVVWLVGFAYIIPGALGVLATALRKRQAYSIQAGLGFSAILILVIIFFQGLMAVRRTSGVHFCEMQAGKCTCGSSELQSLTQYFHCDDINYMVRMGTASDAMFFGGGVVTLISAILGAILARNALNRSQQGSTTPGTGLAYISQGAPQINPTPGSQYQTSDSKY